MKRQRRERPQRASPSRAFLSWSNPEPFVVYKRASPLQITRSESRREASLGIFTIHVYTFVLGIMKLEMWNHSSTDRKLTWSKDWSSLSAASTSGTNILNLVFSNTPFAWPDGVRNSEASVKRNGQTGKTRLTRNIVTIQHTSWNLSHCIAQSLRILLRYDKRDVQYVAANGKTVLEYYSGKTMLEYYSVSLSLLSQLFSSRQLVPFIPGRRQPSRVFDHGFKVWNSWSKFFLYITHHKHATGRIQITRNVIGHIRFKFGVWEKKENDLNSTAIDEFILI